MRSVNGSHAEDSRFDEYYRPQLFRRSPIAVFLKNLRKGSRHQARVKTSFRTPFGQDGPNSFCNVAVTGHHKTTLNQEAGWTSANSHPLPADAAHRDAARKKGNAGDGAIIEASSRSANGPSAMMVYKIAEAFSVPATLDPR
jgi:hypothetical protein